MTETELTRSVKTTTPGIGLALSGGGFRATLFHIGTLWRLNELGLLPELREVTSVSGGSITAAYLGMKWTDLDFSANGVATNFPTLIARPLQDFCGKTIDIQAGLKGLLTPHRHASYYLIKAYEDLYGDATLQALPEQDKGPRFTLYATSLQTGASVRLAQPYLADYHLGLYRHPEVPLTTAVAASSGFPPIFCPVPVTLDPDHWENAEGADLHDRNRLKKRLYLADGGIYDNLGIERVFDRYESVFVSDAGSPFDISESVRLSRLSYLGRTKRTLDVMGAQTRAIRVRWLVGDFQKGSPRGSYWGLATRIANYGLEASGKAPAIVRDTATTAAPNWRSIAAST